MTESTALLTLWFQINGIQNVNVFRGRVKAVMLDTSLNFTLHRQFISKTCWSDLLNYLRWLVSCLLHYHFFGPKPLYLSLHVCSDLPQVVHSNYHILHDPASTLQPDSRNTDLVMSWSYSQNFHCIFRNKVTISYLNLQNRQNLSYFSALAQTSCWSLSALWMYHTPSSHRVSAPAVTSAWLLSLPSWPRAWLLPGFLDSLLLRSPRSPCYMLLSNCCLFSEHWSL